MNLEKTKWHLENDIPDTSKEQMNFENAEKPNFVFDRSNAYFGTNHDFRQIPIPNTSKEQTNFENAEKTSIAIEQSNPNDFSPSLIVP